MLKIQFYSLSCDMTVFFTLFKIWFVDLYLIDLEEPSILNICDMSCKFFFLRLLSFFLAALGLRCSEGAFSNCSLCRASLVVVFGLSCPARECPCGI